MWPTLKGAKVLSHTNNARRHTFRSWVATRRPSAHLMTLPVEVFKKIPEPEAMSRYGNPTHISMKQMVVNRSFPQLTSKSESVHFR